MTAQIAKLLPAVALVFLFGCQDDEQVTQSEQSVSITGYVQKGPFINGTAITVSELDQKLVATGKNFTTQIIDNKGSFSLKDVKLQSDFVQLIAEGFYFDEVRGEKSAAQLTLFALADVSSASSVNVNLLSHLEKDRVIYLMQEEEKSFTTAKQQAQREILTIFGIEKADMMASELLDISQGGEDNAILLAISAILQGNNSVAELSELLANIITDTREDGVLDSESTQEKIRTNAMSLTLADIRKHLEVRYEEIGVDAIISNFEQYVDSDGDGFLNKDEDDTPDEFAFEAQVDVATNTLIVSNEAVISGLKEGGKSDILVEGGALVVNNLEVASTSTQVSNGDKVKVAVRSSHKYETEVFAVLKIGSTDKTFAVKTKASLYQRKANFPLDELVVAGFAANEMFYVLTASNAFYMYDPSGDVWHQKAVFKGEARMRTISFSIDNKGYLGLGSTIEGSESGAERYLSDFWRYDLENDNWTRITDFKGGSRIEAYSYVNNHKAYIGLGSRGGTFFTDTWEYDPILESWTKKSDFPATGRNDAVTLTGNGKGFIGLGRIYETDMAGDFWEYDPQTDSWARKATYPDENNSGGVGLTLGDQGYVFTNTYRISSYTYNFEKDSWKEIKSIDTDIHPQSIVVKIEGKDYYLNPNTGELHEFIPPQD